MMIFHVDDLDKPESERRIDQVRCQLCQLPTKTEYKYHGTTTQMLTHIIFWFKRANWVKNAKFV